ncbi:unnamed protein product [Kluyveromyces dobzhanskii CBS 2104]|uniref:Tethering factor for nuclear proteasome STS1 n=1 Tax=Kluyveromyces dobzhanskii CBS 2104 TaxID=1427455 RepID=A0A0A8L6X3_9SACH|nr:unnamed protein product [Kluyveromyces dobzhanskii CBS 2104]
MSQSVGFQWGFRPSVASGCLTGINQEQEQEQEQARSSGNIEAHSEEERTHSHAHGQHRALNGSISSGAAILASSGRRIGKPRVKRRHAEEDVHMGPVSQLAQRVSKRKPVYRNYIQGQPLPFPRSVELMDKQLLQSVLLSLIREHPEVQHTLFSKVQSLNFNMEQYAKVLKDKLSHVYEDIPYSRYNQSSDGLLNDYAFGRMKASIMEFLNCAIDFLLSSIPPQSDNVLQSLKFLNCTTDLLNQLPDFETASNNYYKNMCFEQIAEIWCSCIQFASTDLSFMSVVSNLEDWESVLHALNKRSNNRLQKPLELIATIKRSSNLVPQNRSAHPLSQPQPSTVGFLNISS